jgi:CHAT domain-containing protein
MEKLSSFRPHVVHLLAHGEYDESAEVARIAMEDEAGRSNWLPDHQFVQLFRQTDLIPHIVLLHACEGGAVGFSSAFVGLAPRLVGIGVQAVIAMQYPVTNGAASAFAVAFYEALAAQSAIDEAVQTGRARMTELRPESFDTGEFGIPVLYLRSKESTPVTVR